MTVKILLKYVNITILATSVIVLVMIWRKRLLDDFRYFALLLATQVVCTSITIPLLFFRKQLHIPPMFAYDTYFYVTHTWYALEMVLQILTIYAVYRLALRGLEGLQNIGQILFRWIAGVSFGISIFFAIGPHISSDYRAVIISQIHQGISVLSLCLLLFVCLALRTLGLTFRSYIFGVSLGLGVEAATSLIEAAWLPTPEGHSLYSSVFLISAVATLVSYTIWMIYFAMPEPERKLVLLPTTSPFFLWNSISEALGDEPGQVAIAGFTPDMLSKAEMEELSRSANREDAEQENAEPEDAKEDDPNDPSDHDDGPGGALQRALTIHPIFPS